MNVFGENMPERLVIDTSMSYEAGLVGISGDESHPYNGKKITRIEFNKNVKSVPSVKVLGVSVPGAGRGDAHVAETTASHIRVHYWLDAGTKLTYNLKVWLSDE
ncbi:hypothetical protein [Nostoc sp. PCC 7524]|uniref:hypothetical protein n=1 Tax=Nostoc sp. (strain ATCC 29411 / PCC 7524) TaxID=28072 RepID=UPI00068789BD|nr:hypothetical protein [Nostoc sp. PCC 7524]